METNERGHPETIQLLRELSNMLATKETEGWTAVGEYLETCAAATERLGFTHEFNYGEFNTQNNAGSLYFGINTRTSENMILIKLDSEKRLRSELPYEPLIPLEQYIPTGTDGVEFIETIDSLNISATGKTEIVLTYYYYVRTSSCDIYKTEEAVWRPDEDLPPKIVKLIKYLSQRLKTIRLEDRIS